MSNTYISSIKQTISQLRQLVRLEVQQSWHNVSELNTNKNLASDLTKIDLQQYSLAAINDKGYIVFPQGREILWLAQKFTIPQTLNAYELTGLNLRLVLTWWAEDAQIFINGNLVQQGDLFDSSARVLICDRAIPETEFTVAIRLVSPNHDIGALMRSYFIFEADKVNNYFDPGLVADELEVLTKYLTQFEPDKLEILATEIATINWNNIQNKHRFDLDLNNFRQKLLPLANKIKQRCFHLLGHAHLDMAWLWTTTETYQVAQRTFESVLNLQQDFPQLTFGHTTPALYQWIEQHRPDLFTQIKQAVNQGNWEILGGMWVEPEVTLTSGESLVRQLLYGQQYLQDKFGDITRVGWLPDSFGFTWQLPQIFKQAGIDYFVTGKLHWNDTTKFPLGCFWWQSPDGTKLLTLMSPPNVTGVMDTNPITMTNSAIDWETQTKLQDIFWLPGVGDHGGGPTKDMLEVAEKWHDSPFFPEIKFTRAIDYLNKIEASPQTLPVWNGELYLELHRGCYTVHADQKKFNRDCEGLLYQAELFASLANYLNQNRLAGTPFLNNKDNTTKKSWYQQWQQQIELAWKKVLFNQFHDILPGTSIPEVFVEANRDWQAAIDMGNKILQVALADLASQIKLPPPPHPEAQPLIVFNSLNWQRTEIVSLTLLEENNQYLIYDLAGEQVRSQYTNDNQLLFLAADIPSVGYRLFWLVKTENLNQELEPEINSEYILENQYLKVIVNPDTGDLDSIYDKINHLEILSAAGNQLQAFEDQGQYWDAWNIDPNYEQKPLPSTKLISIQWLDFGTLQQRIRVVRKINQSEFIQDYILETHSPILKIENNIDWQETHVMVKAAFPLNLASDYVTYEIPCGAIERSTKPETKAEKAKWEVSALKWIDLTDANLDYGVSILNDGKYGYDSRPNQLRITLLRAPVWPDPQSDRGKHHFTYAIYPHKYSWQKAQTVHRSYELNLALLTVIIKSDLQQNKLDQHLAAETSFIDLSSQDIILMALKMNQDNNIIIRFYECHGQEAKINLINNLDLNSFNQVNLLEQIINSEKQISLPSTIEVNPWQILSLKLS